ncbi:MAG: riboflavin synthase [Bdellovibrionales bacterium]|nr:riboflavin synthase [Bdellovibrionales bacterium]
MFTGIVKSVHPILKVIKHKEELKIQVEKPDLSDCPHLKLGDSVAVDGVCLTLEKLSSNSMYFHLGYETLKVTGWDIQNLQDRKVNLEPALRVGDFMGGHFVSGHVDGMVEVLRCTKKGASLLMSIKIPKEFKPYFWKKSFITLNGVSLTVNEVKEEGLFICLVPETLKRTNLLSQKPGSLLTFEVDSLSRALISTLKSK